MEKFELLNVESKNSEREKVQEFEKLVINYINSKDKFINKDSTIDISVKNFRNIMGHLSKTIYNMRLENIGLCNIEKTYKYDYTKLFALGHYMCEETIFIYNIVEDEKDKIYREYIVLPDDNNPIYRKTREKNKDTEIIIEYDRQYRIISHSTFIKDKLEIRMLYDIKDLEDGTITVEEKKQVSEDTEPIFVSKFWFDSLHRIIRVDTCTGSSKRITFDDKIKVKEDYYQDNVLISRLRYEYKVEEEVDGTRYTITMIRDNYDMYGNIFASIIIEERERVIDLMNNRIKYQRITKYHNGIKMYEKINTIEFKSRSDGSRVERQKYSIVDDSKKEPIRESEENIIDFDEDGRQRLIVTIRSNGEVVHTVREYSDDDSDMSIDTDTNKTQITNFEDDPSTIKEFKSSDNYDANVLYTKFISGFEITKEMS